MLRNSTILVILLLVVFLVMVSYVHDLKLNIVRVSESIRTQKPTSETTGDSIEESVVGIGDLVHGALDKTSDSTMIPIEPSKLLSVTKDMQPSTTYDPTEQIPLPVSGRFFESGEFHMVGHLTRVQGYRQDRQENGTALPLYGQRVPTGKLAWVYAVIGSDGRKYIVHVPAPMEQGYINCAESAHGCRQLVSGDMVAVPDVDEGALWRVRMFSKL